MNEEYTSRQITVPSEFEDIFSHFYIARNQTENSIHKTLIPSFQTILVFSFGNPVSFSSSQNTIIEVDKCVILGPVKQTFEYTLSKGAEILVANFKDDAFYRFFGQVVLSNHLPFNPDNLLNENCFADLWQLLKNVDTNKRVDLILEFCKPYLKNRETSFEGFKNIKNDYSVFNPIKIIAQETNQTERTVQLNHKKYFGYTSKEISRYQKFAKAIEILQANPNSNWFDIINECGYYDQSHLIHDFNHYLNLSPNQYLKFQQDICKSSPE